MADLADTIRNIPLFSGLSREDVAKIMGHLVEVEFSGGDRIFAQGDKGDALYLNDGAYGNLFDATHAALIADDAVLAAMLEKNPAAAADSTTPCPTLRSGADSRRN